ncbi:MAG: ABC transporter ATP-binding protein [Haloarculaceae archaeon]
MTDADPAATEPGEDAAAADEASGPSGDVPEGVASAEPNADSAPVGPEADGSPGDRVVAESLRRSFGDLTVLSGVSFSAAPGTVNCFVGPNGSGKTTLLRIVAGLLAPTGGRVDVGDATGRVVGYLPQSPSFRPQFTLRETLGFYEALAGVDIDPQVVLARVGLDAVADRRVGELSGGMTRLFGIAQATVGDPPVLVLDEPSSGLDPTMTEHVGTVIRELADDGHTVLLATHDLETVDRVADTVLVLDDGVVQVADTPEALRRETDAETLTRAVAQYLVGEAGGLTVRTGSREGDDE